MTEESRIATSPAAFERRFSGSEPMWIAKAVGDDYVRRNLSPAEVDEVINDPELVRAVRERMESPFESGRLDPGAPPD